LLTAFGYIGLFFIIAILFTITTISIPIALRIIKITPRNPGPVKNSTFECGMRTIGTAWVQFNFRYYFYALIFLVLDVMVVFLYPWAVNIRQTGYYSLIGVVILIVIPVIGYIYAWKKRVLEWK
jgi:NADH-quinone oxidoreductase subunit A